MLTRHPKMRIKGKEKVNANMVHVCATASGTLKALFYIMLAATSAVIMRTRSSAVILMYHSFDDTAWKYGVRPRNLERQITYLARHKHVVPLSDVVTFARRNRDIPEDSVTITVDDVYEDTYTILFPLLKKHNIPATLFLTTDLSPHEKLGNLPRPTWVQLREMQNSGLVTVEVHGRTHVNWTEIENDPERLGDEVLGAREDIARELGYMPRFAAYPAGRRSPKLEAYLRDQGFEAALAITEGAVYLGDNPHTLKRVQVDKSMNMILFKLRLKPRVLQCMNALRKIIGKH